MDGAKQGGSEPLMAIIVIGGLLGVSRTKQEVFSQFTLDIVTVGVPYPRASPAEVEQGITLAVEEWPVAWTASSVSRPPVRGRRRRSAELLPADPDQVLSDAKSAVDRITTFPADAEGRGCAGIATGGCDQHRAQR